jgi:hypothetical protein
MQILRCIWKAKTTEMVCRPVSLKNSTNAMSLEILSNAKGKHIAIAEQAIMVLCRQVQSQNRHSTPRTLKELYQAGFNSLNSRMCRDLLNKWIYIITNAKRPAYVERPSWWPEEIRYTRPREMNARGK